jgi:DNA-binding CsgD family transcriptional regulator
MKLKAFLDISQAADRAVFEQRLLGFAAALDFDIVQAALVVEKPGQAAKFEAIGNTPKAFLEAARNVEDSLRDPVLKRLRRLSVPFIYDQDLYVNEAAADLWEEQARFGYRTGISVALHLPAGRHFLLGFDRSRPLPQDDVKLTRLLADLQLLAVHAQDAALRLLDEPENSSPPPRLTVREVEILQYTMDGKSAWAIGQILGLSEHTINFHLRNVMKKLDSASKHQAVLKALALGLL